MKKLSWILLLAAALMTGCSQPGDETNQTGASLDGADKVVHASNTEFEALINGEKPVLVDFFATW